MTPPTDLVYEGLGTWPLERIQLEPTLKGGAKFISELPAGCNLFVLPQRVGAWAGRLQQSHCALYVHTSLAFLFEACHGNSTMF